MCEICGAPNAELHHIIYRSEVKALEKCKLNHARLCSCHHRGTNGVHGKYGDKLNRQLRLKFQNELELLFLKNEYTLEEIKEILGISYKAVVSLSKRFRKIITTRRTYYREDIIRACMNDKLIFEGE